MISWNVIVLSKQKQKQQERQAASKEQLEAGKETRKWHWKEPELEELQQLENKTKKTRTHPQIIHFPRRNGSKWPKKQHLTNSGLRKTEPRETETKNEGQQVEQRTWREPSPPGANPLVAERAPWKSSQSRVTGGQQPIGNPSRFLSFLLRTWHPCATPIVTRGEGFQRPGG